MAPGRQRLSNMRSAGKLTAVALSARHSLHHDAHAAHAPLLQHNAARQLPVGPFIGAPPTRAPPRPCMQLSAEALPHRRRLRPDPWSWSRS